MPRLGLDLLVLRSRRALNVIALAIFAPRLLAERSSSIFYGLRPDVSALLRHYVLRGWALSGVAFRGFWDLARVRVSDLEASAGAAPPRLQRMDFAPSAKALIHNPPSVA